MSTPDFPGTSPHSKKVLTLVKVSQWSTSDYFLDPTTRNVGESVKRRRFLSERDAFRWIAGSFRRVLLWPKTRWQQCPGIRPAALWQVAYERQERSQRIALFISTLKSENTNPTLLPPCSWTLHLIMMITRNT